MCHLFSFSQSFLEHGADVVITSTYQASLQGFHDNLNVTISEAEGIIANSVAIAKETCETFWEKEKNNNSEYLIENGNIIIYGS